MSDNLKSLIQEQATFLAFVFLYPTQIWQLFRIHSFVLLTNNRLCVDYYIHLFLINNKLDFF